METTAQRELNYTFSIENFSFFYPEQPNSAVSDLSLKVHQGEFLVLCGPSGCGKSTMLRQLKPALTPHGHKLGSISFEGRSLSELTAREQSELIGFVQQSPENQIVTDKVWHELAFGLESLGYDTPTIRKRVAEMASFFGIESWFYKDVAQLSGGQKQMLNLASVMAMQPSVLILDEPTAQLDPIAAADFLATLGKINRELGTTVILTEHRLEESLPLASRVAVMDQGKLICVDTPKLVGQHLKETEHSMFLAMPTPMRVWACVKSDAPCPITVADGRAWLSEHRKTHTPISLAKQDTGSHGEVVLTASQCWFRYEKDAADTVKDLSLTLHEGELFAILGGNGTGKTTSLKLLAGLQKPYRGTVKHDKTIGVLPQNPQTLFVKKTVREDLFEILNGKKMPKETAQSKVAYASQLCRLSGLLDRHPYDLSGGEQQRVALAKILLLDPEIILMDEPTKGLDAEFKQVFAQILQVLLKRKTAILMVSHDIEFCAKYAHRCALFFDGSIVTEAQPREFFMGNSFYTTAANRMGRGLYPQAVTAEDLMIACGGKPPSEPQPPKDDNTFLPPPKEGTKSEPPKKLAWWRKLIATISACAALYFFVQILSISDLTTLIGTSGVTDAGKDSLVINIAIVLCLLVFTVAVARKSPPSTLPIQVPREERKLQKRTVIAAAMILLLIPITLFVGNFYLVGRRYYLISLLILLECMLPFFLVFENRKPKARELVIIAVLCALGVAGRAAFFMLPQFKPVIAMTIISGIALGGEVGFMVGSMTMLASNVLFSQGPLTPWQMFAMGIIGFLAGVLYRKGLLRSTRLSTAIFGMVMAIVVYGGIMNPASALTWGGEVSLDVVLAYFITGLPFDIVHGIATFLFLWFGAQPLLEKLERVKIKYGLI